MTHAACAFQVNFDEPRNTLVVRYRDHVRDAEAKQCLEILRGLIPGVHPGFRILVDLTELISMDVACAPYLEKIMDICNAAGVSMVARAVSNRARDIGLQIMSIFHYDKEVRTITCDSVAEAMRILEDEPNQR